MRRIMSRFLICVASLFLLFANAGTLKAQTRTPAETVHDFYKFSDSRSAIFDRRHIELRKRWYTPALYRAFLDQLREDAVYLKQHPTDKPFFGDGLDFRPLDEPCEVNGRSYRRARTISPLSIQKNRAVVAVRFAYPAACTTVFERIVYRVHLVKFGNNWLIDDLAYPGGSTLRSDMRGHSYN
jgi:hypothetical protein